jgi:hypothetical protein
MAKRKTELKELIEPLDLDQPGFIREGVDDYFVNSLGTRVYCNPIGHDYIGALMSAIEAKHRARGEPLDPPTYQFEAEGGSTITAIHDEQSLRTPEEHAAWDAYQAANQRLIMEQTETTVKALCLKGVKVDLNSPEYRAWLEEEEFIGSPLPASDLEKRYRYIRSALVITATDVPDSDKMKLTETCLMLGFRGATKEQIAQARSLFRRSMDAAGNGAVGSDTAGRPEPGEGQ